MEVCYGMDVFLNFGMKKKNLIKPIFALLAFCCHYKNCDHVMFWLLLLWEWCHRRAAECLRGMMVAWRYVDVAAC